MNKQKILFALTSLLCTHLTAASDSHSFITQLSTITQPLWQQTTLPASSDPAFELSPTLHTLPGLPATSTLFFSRTPVLTQLSGLLNAHAPFFTDHQKQIEAVNVQEHTLGMQLGQQWQQDHWEVSWQWWLGLRERNAWLPKEYRAQNQDTKSPWHASAVRAGIGDIHLTARYRLPMGTLGALSLGGHWLVPVGTKKQRKKNDDSIALPTSTDPFMKSLSTRVRDLLLCAPFGTNGHAGLGLSATLHMNLGANFSFFGQATSIRFKEGKEKRFGLLEHKRPPILHTGGLDVWSEEDEVTTYARTYVFPTEQEITLTLGALSCASAHLAYTIPDLHLAVGYRYQRHDEEEAENVSTALLRGLNEQHQVALTSSATNRHDWGDSSSYFTATYTFAGAQKGTWSIGFGATVQA